MPDSSKTSVKIFILNCIWRVVRDKNILRFVGTSDEPGKINSHLQSKFKNKTKIVW